MTTWRLSVCKGPDCKANGSAAVFAEARQQVVGEIAKKCELIRGGCYGLCHLGPNVVIRRDEGKPYDPLSSDDFLLLHTPGETYYWAMTAEKMARVISEHVVHDRPVVDLIGNPDATDRPAEAALPEQPGTSSSGRG